MAAEEEQELTPEQLDEEFSVWKKNTPFLYDLVISHPLEWPSLTVQWVPLSSPLPHPTHSSLALHRLVLGTHTSDDFPNFLMIADALLPTRIADPNFDEKSENSVIPKNFLAIILMEKFCTCFLMVVCGASYKPEKCCFGCYFVRKYFFPFIFSHVPIMINVEITQKMRVDGEVNRARCMPQQPAVIAAKTSGCEVYVFDSTKQAEKPQQNDCDPDLRLKGHDKEGYGLSWSPFRQGYLLSGSHDNKICLWDVSAAGQDKVLDALHVYEAHESVVGDVSWHLKNENLFGSVGDDCRLMIWDLRTNQTQYSVKAHEKEVNHLSFNPYNEWILATASSDATVGLFDMRKLSAPLHVLSGHAEEVFQVEWDPNHETVLASTADDRRLNVWDLNRIGAEQLELDAEDGPPELLFSHGGHKAKISDFSWNRNEPWVISSVADDNTLQVWQMDDGIYRDDDDDMLAANDQM